MLISTKPKNERIEAVILRSRQLTDIKWTPLRDVPTYDQRLGQTVLPAGGELVGLPYASTEKTDRFIAENLSIESFFTLVSNPDSKLYQPGHAAYNASNYGIVCNGLVRYAFGLIERVNTKNWFSIPGMRLVKAKGEYKVDEIELCDVLYAYGEGRNHVSLITDIIKNENGEIVFVEVSEAVRPLCKRVAYTPEEFYKEFNLFSLSRYDLIDTVPLFDKEEDEKIRRSAENKTTPKIIVDNGNRSNYREGDWILISVFSSEDDTVVISKDGEVIEEVKTFGRAFFPRALDRGYYTASLSRGGESVEFAVVAPEIKFEISDGFVELEVDSMDSGSELLYMEFRKSAAWFPALVKTEILTEEEKRSGAIRRELVQNGDNVKLYFKNIYGIWSHPAIKIY